MADKTITLTLFNGFSGTVKSNIELYYSLDNIELITLGTSKDNTSFNITFDDSKQVYLFFKYVNTNIDLTKCIDTFQLDSKDTKSVYNEDLMLFELGSITDNDTLRERMYASTTLDLQLTNATCNITEIDYTHDTLLEVSAIPGYFFNVLPTIKYVRPGVSNQIIELELNEDRTKASLLFSARDSLTKYYHETVQAIAEVQTIISQDYGLISIYKPTSEILKDLPSKTLYEKSYTIGEGGIQIETIDLSKNIINIFSIPLDIEPIGTKDITLQGIPTNLSSEYIDNNIYSLDFGYVDIEGIYQNSIDYKNTKIFIYLPFISMQELNISKYMNKRIYLTYTIDIFSGDFLAELKVNNLITDTFSGNMAIKVPYITNGEKTQSVSSYSMLDKNNLLSDRVPKIIIESNDINNDTIYDTQYYTTLDSLEGFNVVSNLQLQDDVKINSFDLEQIENLLSQGIIF